VKPARRILRKLTLAAGALATALVLAELAVLAWLHWSAPEDAFQRYASIAQLRDRYGTSGRFQAHRHLGYSPTPGYEKGGNRHNRLGFRGEEIERSKRAGTLRIACCGARPPTARASSTTTRCRCRPCCSRASARPGWTSK
jgi:hypothetical protein